MRRITFGIVLLLAIINLTNCKKFGKEFDTFFFTDIDITAGPLFLYIDDKIKGELPNLRTTASVTNDTILTKAMHLKLHSGRYRISAKDVKGQVRYSGILTFRSGYLKTSGEFGKHEIVSAGNVVVAKYSY